jgi:hypothetical protein
MRMPIAPVAYQSRLLLGVSGLGFVDGLASLTPRIVKSKKQVPARVGGIAETNVRKTRPWG